MLGFEPAGDRHASALFGHLHVLLQRGKPRAEIVAWDPHRNAAFHDREPVRDDSASMRDLQERPKPNSILWKTRDLPISGPRSSGASPSCSRDRRVKVWCLPGSSGHLAASARQLISMPSSTGKA